MWNEINPLTPAGISLAESEFHARSAFHKSRKGFISLRSVLKGTTHIDPAFFGRGMREDPSRAFFDEVERKTAVRFWDGCFCK